MAFMFDTNTPVPANPSAGLVVDIVQPRPQRPALPLQLVPSISITAGEAPKSSPLLLLTAAGLLLFVLTRKR